MPDTKPAQCRIFLSCLALVPLSCPVETRRSHDDVQMIRPCPIKQRSRVRRFFFTHSSRDAGKQGDHCMTRSLIQSAIHLGHHGTVQPIRRRDGFCPLGPCRSVDMRVIRLLGDQTMAIPYAYGVER